LLCESGSIATGDLNFTSTEPAPQPTEHVSTIDIDAHDSHLNPFLANVDDHMPSSGPIDIDEIETPSSSCSKNLESRTGKKRKLSIARVLQNYVDIRANETKIFMNELNETTKEAGDYSIKRCLDLLESIEELSDEEKAQATNVLKCEVNKEIFMNFKIPKVRLLWVKGEIAPKVTYLHMFVLLVNELNILHMFLAYLLTLDLIIKLDTKMIASNCFTFM
jgi:hypothetical protein